MSYTNQLLDEERIAELFYERYCEHCPSLNRIPATRIDPPETTCHVGLDYTDSRCFHNGEWEDMMEALEDVFQRYLKQ